MITINYINKYQYVINKHKQVKKTTQFNYLVSPYFAVFYTERDLDILCLDHEEKEHHLVAGHSISQN